MSAEDKIGLMEEEALKRKERLKALKRKHEDAAKEEKQFELGTLPK